MPPEYQAEVTMYRAMTSESEFLDDGDGLTVSRCILMSFQLSLRWHGDIPLRPQD